MKKSRQLTFEQRLEGLSREGLRALIRMAQARIGAAPGRRKKLVEALTLLMLDMILSDRGLKRGKICDLLAGQPGMPGTPEGIANALSKAGAPTENLGTSKTGAREARRLLRIDFDVEITDEMKAESTKKASEILAAITKLKR